MSSRGVRGVIFLALGLALPGAALEGRAAAAPPPLVTGVDYGVPDIRLFDGAGRQLSGFFALDSPEVAGVAVGDVDGDGQNDLVTGSGQGGPPRVRVFDRDGNPKRSFLAYAPQATAGVFVAVADVTGDGRADIVTGAAGGGSHVRVWDGRTGSGLTSFFAFDGVTVGGVSVAAADVDGDGRAEIVAGGGVDAGPLVRVFDRNGGFVRGFAAFDPKLGGGVLVAAGDTDGDGRAEIVAGARDSTGPQVTLFEGSGAPRWSLSPFAGATTVAVAVADVTGDGKAEVLAGAVVDGLVVVKAFDAKGSEVPLATGEPRWAERVALGAGDLDGDRAADVVAVADSFYQADLRGLTASGKVVASFRPADPLFTGGMRVAEGDVDGDGTYEVIAAPGWGRRPEVRVFDQQGDLLGAFDAFDPVYRGGLYVASGDVNGDGRAEIVVGAGEGDPVVRVLDGRNGDVLASFDAYDSAFYGGIRVAVADVNGDGVAEIVTGAGWGGGPHVQILDGRGRKIASFFAFDQTQSEGVWVAGGDVNGDGRDDVVAGFDGWPAQVKVFDGFRLGELLVTIPTPDLGSGVRVGAGDLDGDGNAEIVATGSWGGLVQVFRGDGSRVASFKPYAGFDGGLFVASGVRLRGRVLRNAPPFEPIVKGPRSTTSRRPVYRFLASDPDSADSEIRYRCSFDSRRLHACAARYSQRVGVGRHVLRVRAEDGDGGRSAIRIVRVTIRKGRSREALTQ